MVIKSCDDALLQAEHWKCSKLCPLWTVFISCVRHVPPIMKVRVDIDIVCYNNYYYLQSWTKVLGRAMQYSFFLSFWVPSSNSASFLKLIFLAVLPPPTLYKVETQKKFWIHPSNIVWGLRGGVGPVWIGNAQKCKSVPRLFSMIVVGR